MLSVLVKNGELEVAERILHELRKPIGEEGKVVADVVTHNTVMKG